MPAPLPVPHVPMGFPPRTAAGSLIAHPGGQTTQGIEAGGQTTTQNRGPRFDRPGNKGGWSDYHPGQLDRLALRNIIIAYFANFHRALHSNHYFERALRVTYHSGHVQCSTYDSNQTTCGPTSMTLVTSRAAPMTLAVPHVAPASHFYPQHYSCHPQVVRDPPAPHR
jgi:hypothetical protein